MSPEASSSGRPRWRRPQRERFLIWLFLGGFLSILGMLLLFMWLNFRRDGNWFGRDDVCVNAMLVPILVLFLVGLAMAVRDERRFAESYLYSWKGRYDEIESKVLTALDLQGLERVTTSSGWIDALRLRLAKSTVVVHSVPSIGFWVRLENNLEREDDPTDDSCTVLVGPVSDATHPAIFRFIEAFNSLFDDEERPKLVVWGRRTGGPSDSHPGNEEAEDEGE